MKARLLKKILNNTDYNISNGKDYIAVGSYLCHDLIKVDKSTLKVKYALDTRNKGRKCLEEKDSTELLFIWDKLHELIETGEINKIIIGKDIIENPLPVFTVVNGELVESVTDKYGYPNTDDNGILMYNNTHFKTKKEALEYFISESEGAVKYLTEWTQDLKKKLHEGETELKSCSNIVDKLKKEINTLSRNEK